MAAVASLKIQLSKESDVELVKHVFEDCFPVLTLIYLPSRRDGEGAELFQLRLAAYSEVVRLATSCGGDCAVILPKLAWHRIRIAASPEIRRIRRLLPREGVLRDLQCGAKLLDARIWTSSLSLLRAFEGAAGRGLGARVDVVFVEALNSL